MKTKKVEAGIREIENVLAADVYFFVGSASRRALREAAESWDFAGFTADDVDAWCAARCYDPTSASMLRDAGLSPKDAARRTRVRDTLGHEFSAGVMSLEEVLAASAEEAL